MNSKKRKTSYLNRISITLIPLLIVAYMIEFASAFPVGSGVQFHTGSGYFTFTRLLTVNSSVAINGGWNLTNAYLTGDDQTLGYVWLYTSAGHLNISHLIYGGKFTASVTAPSGTAVTIKIKISKWEANTPKSIKIGSQYYPIMARSMQEFDNAQYSTWYWSKGTLYLKVVTQSTVPIEVDWLQTPPEEAPPAAPPEEEEEAPTPTPPSPKGILETIVSYLNYAVTVLQTMPVSLWLLIIVIIIVLIIIFRD